MEFLKSILSKADPNIVVAVLAALSAFISWLVKSFFEKPIENSKATFEKLLQKKIKILSKIKLRLKFIEIYQKEGKIEKIEEYKGQIYDLLFECDKDIYLLKQGTRLWKEEYFEDILTILTTSETDRELLSRTIDNVDKYLNSQISRLDEKISFFNNFSGYGLMGIITGGIAFIFICVIVFILICILFLLAFSGEWWAFMSIAFLIFIWCFIQIRLNKTNYSKKRISCDQKSQKKSAKCPQNFKIIIKDSTITSHTVFDAKGGE